ncbi:MAG: phospholipase D-like domain-containing protein, partial [Rhodospirillaceae bacterium]|nr:phospholipase D-like domain-containing protein [Rhodospirillaceae bacterium]
MFSATERPGAALLWHTLGAPVTITQAFMTAFDGISILAVLHLALAVPLAVHALLTKPQEAAAVGWIALVLLSPFAGSALYLLFGINRIERRARRLRRHGGVFQPMPVPAAIPGLDAPTSVERALFRATSAVQDLPLTPGNSVEPLVDGDQAFPAMLAAIDRATESVALSAYIFDHDTVGERFAEALGRAHARGVAVRVLIDDLGQLYSRKAIAPDLVRRGITVAKFIPRNPKFIALINLRNHRKMLIVDGREAFIGGMNIRHGHVISDNPRHPVRDIHFRVVGPVIDQMSEVFVEDWQFAAGAEIALPLWRPEFAVPASGPTLARLVPDGPDYHFEKLLWVIMGAIGASASSILIMTPYFLPPLSLANALMVAAQRGIAVDVVLPARSNVFFMDWAMQANFEVLLDRGVRIHHSPAPFDHSKVLVVDRTWCLIGSTNWDQRSLRLNFEANLECFDAVLA